MPRIRAVSAALILASLALLLPAALRAEEADEPTDLEQYMLELVNRARLDPEGEAARHGIDLQEGLTSGPLSTEPREPLAMNLDLLAVVRLHNTDLLENFDDLPLDHQGSNGLNPTGRANAGGVDYVDGVAENNSYSSLSGKINESTVDRLHALLFKDFTSKYEVPDRGHRRVMLNGIRDEVGIGVDSGKWPRGKIGICTQDYITTSRTSITGVAYSDDVKKNAFYSVGEGLAGVEVRAVRQADAATFTTTTWRSGGYALPVPDGTYDVTASGGGLAENIVVPNVVVADANVKVDFVPAGPVTPPPPAVFEIVKAKAKLAKMGGWTLQVKKAAFNPGTASLSRDDVDFLSVVIDGTSYFTAETRAGAIVKEKTDAAGGVTKLTVKEPTKNKLVLDILKSRLKIVLKDAPEFDPSDGTVTIEIRLLTKHGVLETTATIVGKKLNKAVLAPATGTVEDSPS